MNEQDMEQPPLVPVEGEDDADWFYVEYDNQLPDEPPGFDEEWSYGWGDYMYPEDDEKIEHIAAVESEDHESIKKWIAEHPEETIKYLAAHLDHMADTYGQSQTARYARLLASEALKLHWMILGVDEAVEKLGEIPGW